MSKATLTFLLAAVLVLGATMCQYNPNPKSGEMLCSDSHKCPGGYECHVDKCYRPEEWPVTTPNMGGTTTITTASTAGAAGASGGTSAMITSSKLATGGQTGGAISSNVSTATVMGGNAGLSIPTTTVAGGSTTSTTTTGGRGGTVTTALSGAGGSGVKAGAGGGGAGGGGAGGGGTGGGGAGDTSTKSTQSSANRPTGTTVTFSYGRAVGAMTGYGWVTFGTAATVTSPTCGTEKMTASCAATTWSTKDSLCATAGIPALDPSKPDYAGNWGVQIGVDATDAKGTLGQSFTSVTIAISGSPTSGLRAKVHLKGDAEGSDYCAAYTTGAIAFTSFTKTCYDTTSPGTAVTAADVTKIDQIGLQVPSGSAAISVSSLCITGITFK